MAFSYKSFDVPEQPAKPTLVAPLAGAPAETATPLARFFAAARLVLREGRWAVDSVLVAYGILMIVVDHRRGRDTDRPF